jgi:hypothetical protein
MLFRIIITTIILLDIILLTGIIYLYSIPIRAKNQDIFEIYLYFFAININLVLVCLFMMNRKNKCKEKKDELLVLIDNTNDIDYINNKIDELLDKYLIFQDKVSLIRNFKSKLIIIRRKELYRDLKLKLRNINDITEETVKAELIILRSDLDNYKEELEIKINNLLELHNIKIFMLNLQMK